MNVDRNLTRYELKVARVWADELRAQKLIDELEFASVAAEIELLLEGEHSGDRLLALATHQPEDDVHTVVRAHFASRGCVRFSEKYFYGRSRNDTSVTLLQLWIADLASEIGKKVLSLAALILESANTEMGTSFISFTHERPSDVTPFAQYLIAYFYSLVRCLQRFRAISPLASGCPLGVGAMAGSDAPVDRCRVARKLGYDAAAPSGIDQVSGRGAATDFAYAVSQLMCELGVISQDLLFWSSMPRPLISLSEASNTASVTGILKVNPTLLFEIRADYGSAIGELVKVTTMRKGVCSGYCADLSLDKAVVDTLAVLALRAIRKTAAALSGVRVHEDNVRELVLSTKFSFLDQACPADGVTSTFDVAALIRSRLEAKRNFGGDSSARMSETLANAKAMLNNLKQAFH